MHNIITTDVLKTMTPEEMEDWRDSGEDFRRELTHAVMRDLDAPAGWDMNGEYRCEFGGMFPVQVRFTPSCGDFQLALCSPGYVSPEWRVMFISASGRPFAVVRSLPAFSPENISYVLSLTALFHTDGYSAASIISILQEGNA